MVEMYTKIIYSKKRNSKWNNVKKILGGKDYETPQTHVRFNLCSINSIGYDWLFSETA